MRCLWAQHIQGSGPGMDTAAPPFDSTGPDECTGRPCCAELSQQHCSLRLCCLTGVTLAQCSRPLPVTRAYLGQQHGLLALCVLRLEAIKATLQGCQPVVDLHLGC